MDKMIVVFGGNGRRFSINFKYDKSICELIHSEYNVIRRKCICTIVEEISESCKQRVEISKEFSICHPKDSFNKEIGRKIALTRTLYYTRFGKSIRREFWNAYLNRKNK
jgi:hypothetical protein